MPKLEAAPTPKRNDNIVQYDLMKRMVGEDLDDKKAGEWIQ